jgi:phosphatidylglycerol:prolipoprotein diacylglycerol transferase
MIPFFQIETIPFWPVPLRAWGLLVTAGLVAALWYGRREARRRHLSPEAFTDFMAVITLVGLLGARVGYFLFYDFTPLLKSPLAFFKLWEGGLSLIGTVVAVALYLACKRQDRQLLQLAEVAALAYPLGEAIGRLGCFVIHDHPGIPSASWLAVAYPDGPRLDHGLLLSLAAAATFALFIWLNRRRPHPAPFFLPLLAVLWGFTRFVLDFLRAYDLVGADTRYAGLTPAQYGSLALVAVGLYFLAKARR